MYGMLSVNFRNVGPYQRGADVKGFTRGKVVDDGLRGVCAQYALFINPPIIGGEDTPPTNGFDAIH